MDFQLLLQPGNASEPVVVVSIFFDKHANIWNRARFGTFLTPYLVAVKTFICNTYNEILRCKHVFVCLSAKMLKV